MSSVNPVRERFAELARLSGFSPVDLEKIVAFVIGNLLAAQFLNPVCPFHGCATSALDVVTQRQVMETIDRVQMQINAAVILIGHDMGLMAQFVDKVVVMYAGRLVEICTVREMFTNPRQPYSKALINCLPSLENKGQFQGIPGLAPSLLRLPSGCAFHPRCAKVIKGCETERPEPETVQDGHVAVCHLFGKQA